MSSPPETLEFTVPDEEAGQRLDVFLAKRLPQYSRVKLRQAIVADGVLVDGERTKVAYRLLSGQRVAVVLPEMPREGPLPEDIPLDILYEDEHLAAINKPPDMVVHPAKGHWSGTLTSALAHHFQSLSSVGGATRPGIVHRLDRETSGVILVAKTDRAHMALAAQFEGRTVEKEYFALIVGELDRDRDVIDQPIGPHPSHREKMAIRGDHPSSRSATTFYEVTERFEGFTALKAFPKTGRTHQIRVHLAHVGCPILCDRLYGGRSRLTRGELRRRYDDDAPVLERLALHARRIAFEHPLSGLPLAIEAPLREDLVSTLEALRQWRRS